MKIVNNCSAIYNESELKTAIFICARIRNQKIYNVKNVYLYGRYPAVSVGKSKLHIHRIIFECFMWRSTLDKTIHVHHKNGNRLDARLSNLEAMNGGDHISHHNSGRTLSAEHKRKIGIANKKRKGMKYKKRYIYENPELLEKKNDN